MKAENTTTDHNRTLRLTEIPGDILSEMQICISYPKIQNEGNGGPSTVENAVTLDKFVIPAIIDAINKAHAAMERGKCRKIGYGETITVVPAD